MKNELDTFNQLLTEIALKYSADDPEYIALNSLINRDLRSLNQNIETWLRRKEKRTL